MKELFGQIIYSVLISDDKRYLVFDLGLTQCVYLAHADCCSQSWFESINGVENLIREHVIGLEEIEMPKPFENKDGDFITCYGYKLKTKKGYCDIEFRNESNGYYGGTCIYEPDAKVRRTKTNVMMLTNPANSKEELILKPWTA